MTKITINPDYCKGCLVCVEYCSKDVLKASGDINVKGYILPEPIEPDNCIECGLCEIVCPDLAIAVEKSGKQASDKELKGSKMNFNDMSNYFFQKPHHITIVVKDLRKSQAFYESIGIGPWQDYGSLKEYTRLNVPDKEGFYNLKFKYVQIGPLQLQLVEPGKGKSVYKDYLEQKGEGVFHIGFEVDNISDMDEHVEALGLKILQSGRRDDGSGFTYFQTVADAGVTLLVRQTPSSEN